MYTKQECIPVGCVPSAAVAVSHDTHGTPQFHACPHCHTHHLPCMPSTMHALLPCMPLLPCSPQCHRCPLPCMTMLPPTCHAWPCHAQPSATHAPCHACPPTMHAPHHACPCHVWSPLPHTHPCHACPPPLWTDTCENITFANFFSGR